MLTAALPPPLVAALESLRLDARGALDLSDRYRADRASGAVARTAADAAAYAVTRLPATYAAVDVALRELEERVPSFAPVSQLDLGAGTGAALWAARTRFASLGAARAVEAERGMAALGRTLFPEAQWVDGALPAAIPRDAFDLVTIAYVLNELSQREREATIDRAWAAARGALVVVEPGTIGGYRNVLAARERVLRLGGTTVAPCPHDRACPLEAPDWCHFGVRLARTAAHRAAKGAARGHEDEKFSYVVLARTDAAKADARVLRRPDVRSGHVLLQLSTRDGIERRTVSRRDGELYRRARKVSWGEDLAST